MVSRRNDRLPEIGVVTGLSAAMSVEVAQASQRNMNRLTISPTVQRTTMTLGAALLVTVAFFLLVSASAVAGGELERRIRLGEIGDRDRVAVAGERAHQFLELGGLPGAEHEDATTLRRGPGDGAADPAGCPGQQDPLVGDVHAANLHRAIRPWPRDPIAL